MAKTKYKESEKLCILTGNSVAIKSHKEQEKQ